MDKIRSLNYEVKRVCMRGKWSSELRELVVIDNNIDLYERDVAQIKNISPKQVVQVFRTKLDLIEQKIMKRTKVSYYDFRINRIQTVLSALRIKTQTLQIKILKAERTALSMTRACQDSTEKAIEIYSPLPGAFRTFMSHKLSRTFDTSTFASVKTSGANVWASISGRKTSMAYLSPPSPKSVANLRISNQAPADLLHNSLVHLLERSDSDLIEAIDHGSLAIEGEIGHLIIQRLKEIQYAKSSSTDLVTDAVIRNRLAIRAGKIISRTLSNQTNEGLFKCDFDALYLELTKLALHAELHPDQKIIWLGSARAVMAVIDEKNESGTYLNCDDTKWTWHLNRLYLHTAIVLGFTFELVEQHYPKMEEALLSQDGGAAFVQTLLNQVRKDSSSTSQYNGYEAPTATSQEVLVALDIGCIPEKNDNNHRICFSKRAIRDTPCPFQTNNSQFAHRSVFNSWDPSFTASKPPLGSSVEQFSAPKSSPEIRKRTHNRFSELDAGGAGSAFKECTQNSFSALDGGTSNEIVSRFSPTNS